MLFKSGSVISKWDIMPTLRCYQNTNYFDFYLRKIFKSFCDTRNCYMFKTKTKAVLARLAVLFALILKMHVPLIIC